MEFHNLQKYTDFAEILPKGKIIDIMSLLQYNIL